MTADVQIFFQQFTAAMFYTGVCVGILAVFVCSSVLNWWEMRSDRRYLDEQLDKMAEQRKQLELDLTVKSSVEHL